MTDENYYLDPDGDRRMNYALLGVVALQFAIVLGVLGALGAGVQVLLILSALIIAGNFANVYLLTFMLWKPLEKRWPARPVAADPVTRNFQTFWFGPIARYNWCLHASVDEWHIHITPMAPMRWLGAKPISLPLDDITELKPTLVPGLTQCTLHGRRIVGPTWCLKLAQPGD